MYKWPAVADGTAVSRAGCAEAEGICASSVPSSPDQSSVTSLVCFCAIYFIGYIVTFTRHLVSFGELHATLS